jgi:hypothetical protein
MIKSVSNLAYCEPHSLLPQNLRHQNYNFKPSSASEDIFQMQTILAPQKLRIWLKTGGKDIYSLSRGSINCNMLNN